MTGGARLAALVLLAAAPLLAATPARLEAQGWRGWLERARLDGLGERLGTLRRPVIAWGELAVVEHRVTLGAEIEQATGPLLGLGAQAVVTPWLDVRVGARGGTLDADWAPSEDRRMGELSIAADAFPLPWVGVVGSASTRGYRTAYGRQRWTRLTIGPELRVPLLGERVHGRVRLAAAPLVSVSDTRAPSRALEGAATVTYEAGRLRGSLAYAIERYDFEAVGGARRLEQLSGLAVALGWRLGR